MKPKLDRSLVHNSRRLYIRDCLWQSWIKFTRFARNVIEKAFGMSHLIALKETGTDIFSTVDLISRDDLGNTMLLNEGEEFGLQVMENFYPDSVNWTDEQKQTRLQSMYLLNACGLDLSLLPNQPDSQAWTDKYNKLNTVCIKDEASHARDMLVTMSRQILFAPLIQRYPALAEIIKDKANRIVVEQELATALGEALLGPKPAENMPLIALPKILELTNRWDRNRNNLDIGVEEFRLFNIETVTPHSVQAPNGLWLVPLKTYDDLKTEGDTLMHCLWGHRIVCMFDGMNVIGVRYHLDQSAYTAGLIPDHTGRKYRQYSEPLGLRNAAAPLEVHEAWNWFKERVSQGCYGREQDLIAFAKNRSDMRGSLLDVLSIVAGYNPRGEDGMQKAQETWKLWADKMEDRLRYRKHSLQGMIEKGNIVPAFDRLAYDFSHNKKPKCQLSLF